MSGLLAQIEGFKQESSLKPVDTQVTTASGEKYVEKKDSTGKKVLEMKAEKGLGFCPDLNPDLQVGVVMDGVLTASQNVAHDLEELKRHGVTHILNVAYGVPNAYPDDFKYLKVEMFDDSQQDLLANFTLCQSFIDQGRAEGTVLIHCNAGISRSTSVALAYVMTREKIPLTVALRRLWETRPRAKPNHAFMEQLCKMEKDLGITPQLE